MSIVRHLQLNIVGFQNCDMLEIGTKYLKNRLSPTK